ncbi:MAG: hypothetical protein JSV26_07410 [bacterium]|nr:MAG: hypothetical protein JSV26_07410 [bacterium]
MLAGLFLIFDSAFADHYGSGAVDRPVPSENQGVLTGITIQETASEAKIALKIKGYPDYSVTTSVWKGEKWVDLFLRRFSTEVGDLSAGNRRIAGQVRVVSDAPGGEVRVSVQILPSKISYDVFQSGDHLMIRLVPR